MRSKRTQRGYWEFAIPAAASIVGGLIGKSGQDSANETNIQLGREQMEFQERMSSSAYQRAVQDMQKAGLNPMLAYSQGGASSPVGSMPQVQNSAAAGLASASQTMNTMQGMQQLELNKAQAERMRAETEKIKSETFDNAFNRSAKQTQVDYTKDRSNLTLQQAVTELRRAGLVLSQKELNIVMAQLRGIEVDLANTNFTENTRIRKAERILKEAAIPEAEATARFYKDDMGEMNPYIRQLLDIAKAIFSGASAARR